MAYFALLNKIDKNTIKNKKSANGVVTFDAVIGSAKVHEFYLGEVYQVDMPEYLRNKDMHTTIKVNFTKEVVKNSLESASYLPVTNGHPDDLIMNYPKKEALQYLGKGLTSEARLNDKGEIETKISIVDPDLVTDVLNDKSELSWGGLVQYEWLSEEDAKEKGYHAELVNEIIFDHVAVVENGRCGNDCSIKNSEKAEKESFADLKNEAKEIFTSTVTALKSKAENAQKTEPTKNINITSQNQKKGKTMKIVLNEKEFEVDESIANEINKFKGDMEGKITALNKESEDLRKEAEELRKIKAEARFNDIVNKAREIDDSIEIANDDTVVTVIGKVMNQQFENEEVAYYAFTAFHKAVTDTKTDVVQLNEKKDVQSAYEQAKSVYDEILGGK